MAVSATAAQAQRVVSPTGIDYSYAGYRAGGTALPNVPAVISVRPTGGDDTALLQSAIDHVSSMPMAADGFRGAVVLRAGRFRVAGQLRVNASGVVLRGSGVERTTILADGIGRRTLIQIGAATDPEIGENAPLSADAPVGARILKVASATAFHPGDRVVVRRPSTKEWIGAIGMSGLPGTFANQRLD